LFIVLPKALLNVVVQIDGEVAKLKELKLKLKEEGADDHESTKKFVLKCPKVGKFCILLESALTVAISNGG